MLWGYLSAGRCRPGKELSGRHACECLFYLRHVSSGRIETDINNTEAGRLSRDDLGLTALLNALANNCRRQANEARSSRQNYAASE